MSSKKGKSAPPKLHKFMHPRNPYRTPPSFKCLAQKYASFRAHCVYELDGKVRLDFKNPLALRELTTCLLDQDFGLKVSIPEGRLVPTLPLRLNYLLWIEDLLNFSGSRNVRKDFVIGLDVGCGASCVYPLLAAKQNGWYMLGTEADDLNFNSALSNVKDNAMENHILVRKVDQDVIFKGVLDIEETTSDTKMFRDHQESVKSASYAEKQKDPSLGSPQKNKDGYLIDFTMCNPPFFGSLEEADSMGKSKKDRGEPHSAATGSTQETITEGGEVLFISQMIDESVLLREKVRIFSSMIGTKSHVKEVKDKLRSVSPAHIAAVEFCQGRTMRWGLAWTFDPSLHLQNVMSKKQMDSAKPLVLMLPRSLMTVYTVPAAWAMINKWLHQLKISVQVFKNTKYFVGANVKAYKTTWLHQRRKRREQERKLHKGNVTAKIQPEVENVQNISTDGENDIEVMDVDDKFSLKRTRLEDEESELEPQEGIKKIKPSTEDGMSSGVKTRGDQVIGGEASETVSQPDEDYAEEDEIDSKFLKTTKTNVNQGSSGSLECILKAKLQVKQCGALISLEAIYLKGSAGKDGLNQILQYMRNQLTKS